MSDSSGSTATDTLPEARRPAYDAGFWFCYLANASMMVAVSVLFRYADFVRNLGGSELELGLIVGTGMCGALLARLVQGVAIDHYGPRSVWALSLVLFVMAMLLHLAVGSLDWQVYLARVAMMTGIAGAFGASITYISLKAPPGRNAELIGTLGSSGFIGLALGPILGDLIFVGELTRGHVDAMFLLAAGGGLLALAAMWLGTKTRVHCPRAPRPPIWSVLRRYHPGPFLIVGAAMGLAVGLPHTFLRPYTAHLGISGMKTFFVVYAVTAFTVRLSTRTFTDRYGPRRTATIGLSLMAGMMLLMIPVASEWMLALPAVAGGTAHAFLFPAAVGGGASTFPPRYRGLATTLILAMFDIGNLVGQPAVGAMIEWTARAGLAPYVATFTATAAVLLAMCGLYLMLSSGDPRPAADEAESEVTLPPRHTEVTLPETVEA